MPFVMNQGLRIHYRVEGDGPPLVFQHGFGDSLESAYELGYVEALRDNYQPILINARGHGASDKPHEPEAYSFQNVTTDVVAVLDALGIATAHYFGFSMGVKHGFAMAAYALERLRSLMLLATGASAQDHGRLNFGSRRFAKGRQPRLRSGKWMRPFHQPCASGF